MHARTSTHTPRLKNSDKVPAFVDRTFHPDVRDHADMTAASRPEVVAGTDRYKYFRRPLLSMPVHSTFKEAPVVPPPPAPLPPPIPKAKTVGTQSDYRESEAQTTPWEPQAAIPEELTAKQQVCVCNIDPLLTAGCYCCVCCPLRAHFCVS